MLIIHFSESLKMVECVHHSVSACDTSQMEEMRDTNRTLHQMLGLVASHCPMEPILTKINCLQPKCDATAALINCFMTPNETTLAAGKAPM